MVEPFEKVKDQIGFCGIWCGGCKNGNGVIMELTKKYEKIIEKGNLEKWAPKDFDFKEFMKGLSSMQKMLLCPGCLKGGGIPNCEIRVCALEKNVTNCNQCHQLMTCKHLEELEKNYDLKIRKNLIEIKNIDKDVLIEKWLNELGSRWPHCIMFCPSTKDNKPAT